MALHAGPRNSLAFLEMAIQCFWLPLVRSAASLARTACRNGRELALARTGAALVRLRLGEREGVVRFLADSVAGKDCAPLRPPMNGRSAGPTSTRSDTTLFQASTDR